MFRKNFRIRRIVLGLAFAALAAPVTAQASTGYFVDEGPVPVSVTAKSVPTTVTPFEAYGSRLQAMSNRSSALTGRITPLQADGLRWQAMADSYARQQHSAAASVKHPTTAAPQPIASSGFDWKDAGIGASSAFGVALLLLVAVAIGRRNQHSTLTSA